MAVILILINTVPLIFQHWLQTKSEVIPSLEIHIGWKAATVRLPQITGRGSMGGEDKFSERLIFDIWEYMLRCPLHGFQ